MDLNKIEINDEFKAALDLMENGANSVFITGKAGTGKSTLLEYFRSKTSKGIVVLAPTGVAAVNVKGQTIHSFFRFRPGVTIERARKTAVRLRKTGNDKIYRELDTIIIDEISMVRADLLDCIDEFLRTIRRKKKEPFGGVKMIFIGDLYQLPPIVTSSERKIFTHYYKSPYFFSAKVFPRVSIEFIELEKIYRQTDDKFIDILNGIRNNSIADEDIAALNSRFDPDFEPSDNFFIFLTTINEKAAKINEERLSRLRTKLHTLTGSTSGKFETKNMPTEIELKLKKGAQIMLLNNDSCSRWVNGTIGKIVKIGRENISVELPDGSVEDVEPYTWEMFEFSLDEKTHSIRADKVGSFTQYPIRLAWAITIHKSQGKTFDRVILDLERGTFAAGQAYVALSRCRTLDGIVLKHKFQKRHVIVDWRIIKFLTDYQYQISEKNIPLDIKIEIINDAIKSGGRLHITYLKSQDIKSRRVVRPINVGTMKYAGREFLGVRCFCDTRGEERTFRVDRILEIRPMNNQN